MTKEEVLQVITDNITDNNSGDITAEVMRDTLNTMVEYTPEGSSAIPVFEGILEDSITITDTTVLDDTGGVVIYSSYHKKFVLSLDRAYYSSWGNVGDYMDSTTGLPITNRLFEYNKQQYIFDGTSLILFQQPIVDIKETIYGKGIYLTDFTDIPKVSLQIVNGSWTNYGSPQSMILPVIPDREVIIEGTNNRSWYFALLKSDNNIVNGQPVDKCDVMPSIANATLQSAGDRYVAYNSVLTFVAPSDCNFIYITTIISDTDTTPKYYSSGKEDGIIEQLGNKQDILISGTNIKTIDGKSIIGNGNINIQGVLGTYLKQMALNVGFTQGVEFPEEYDEILVYVDTDLYEKYTIYYADTIGGGGLSNAINNNPTRQLVSVPRIEGKKYLYLFNATHPTSADIITTTIYATDSYRLDLLEINKRLDILENPFVGKKIAFFGDSITEFTYPDGGVQKGYPDYVKEYLGCDIYKLGMGGTKLSQRTTPVYPPTSSNEAYAGIDIVNVVKAFTSRDFSNITTSVEWLKNNGDDNTSILASMQNITPQDIDIAVIFGGTNNWIDNQPYDDETSPDDGSVINRPIGALKYIIRMLLEANPSIKILICTPIVRFPFEGRTSADFSDNYTHSNKTLPELVELIKKACKTMHTPCLDLYWELGWNMINFDEYFLSTDGTHPSLGYKPLGEKIAKYIQYQL